MGLKLYDGARFERLVIVHRTVFTKRSKWWVRCDCGTEKEVWGSSLLSGHSKSCGCLHSEMTTTRNYRHGETGTRLYSVWSSIWQRCTNPNDPAFHNYGGRGVTVDERWRDFAVFKEDVGPKPSEKHSLDRCANNKGYEPGNVRWATRAEQARNTRRNVVRTYEGRTQCLKDWASEFGISYYTLIDRIFVQGLSIDKALTKPKGRWAK